MSFISSTKMVDFKKDNGESMNFPMAMCFNRHLIYNFGGHGMAFRKEELIELRNRINESLEYYDNNDISDSDIFDYNEKNRLSSLRDYEEIINKSREERESEPKNQYVYLIHNLDSNVLKIGFSKNPKSRLSQLRISTHENLELLYFFRGSESKESELHKKFKNLRLRSEWFSYSDEIINFFKNQNNPHLWQDLKETR